MKYPITTFSSVYGEGNYNSGTYNGTAVTPAPTPNNTGSSTGTTTSPGSDSGILANTGLDIAVGATLGAVIIFSALLIRLWRKPSKNSDPATMLAKASAKKPASKPPNTK